MKVCGRVNCPNSMVFGCHIPNHYNSQKAWPVFLKKCNGVIDCIYDGGSDEASPIQRLYKSNLKNSNEHLDGFDMAIRSILNRFMEQAKVLLSEEETLK